MDVGGTFGLAVMWDNPLNFPMPAEELGYCLSKLDCGTIL